jgi:hypothetical protein
MADQKIPGDFNALYSQAARASRGVTLTAAPAERNAVARLASAVPEVRVDYDEATQNPVRVSSARPDGRLTAEPSESPQEAARQFVAERADLWELTNSDVDTVEVVSVSPRGLPTVRMIQKVDGVEVFMSDMTAAVAPDNKVVSVAGQLFRSAGADPARVTARAAASDSAAAAASGRLSAEEAIAKAASDLTGFPYKPSDFKPSEERQDGSAYRFYASKWKMPEGSRKPRSTNPRTPAAPLFERPVRVKDVLFPLGMVICPRLLH